MYGVVIAPPLLVTMKAAVSEPMPVHAPLTDNDGGGTGVLVGVLVGDGVKVGVGVFVAAGVLVGVEVGRTVHEPDTFNSTEDRTAVRYVTFMVAYPAPLMDMDCPDWRLIPPL